MGSSVERFCLLLMGIALVIVAVRVFQEAKENSKQKAFVREIMLLVLSGSVTTFIVTDTGLRFLYRHFGLYGMRGVVCAVVIGLGVGAHYWKRMNQSSYGICEVIFGSLSGIFITFSLSLDTPLMSQWVGLGGSAYIIARGLNNVFEAKEKKNLSAIQDSL